MTDQEKFHKLALYTMRQVVSRVRQIDAELTAVGIAAKGGVITATEAIKQFEQIAPGCLPAAYASLFSEPKETAA
jgi:hypothetical protein